MKTDSGVAFKMFTEPNREEKTRLFDHGYYGDAVVIAGGFQSGLPFTRGYCGCQSFKVQTISCLSPGSDENMNSDCGSCFRLDCLKVQPIKANHRRIRCKLPSCPSPPGDMA